VKRGTGLEQRIEALVSLPADRKLPRDARKTVDELLAALESGDVRAATSTNGSWTAVSWVKRGILLGFRIGKLVDSHDRFSQFSFVDKDTYPTRRFTAGDGVRVEPGG
jgi:2,3,4,5-tetrahydropyridine-2-carboxylate N-succinyltransferase